VSEAGNIEAGKTGRLMATALESLKEAYESRIIALLNRWREACSSRNWPTSEIEVGFEELPGSGNPVYSWSIDTAVASGRKAHVLVILEGEADLEWETDGNVSGGCEAVTVTNCLAWASFGARGSDCVRWEASCVSGLVDDAEAFERKFRGLEAVGGGELVNAIEQHVSQNDAWSK